MPTTAELWPQALAAAVAAAPTGIVIADPRLPDCPLVFVNPAFLRMTGYEEAEVLGRNCRFLQGPRTDPAAVAQLREAIAARRPITLELVNHRKDGQPFVNELHIGPVFGTDGELTAFIGIQHDVTERAAALAATRRARRAAERANAAKSEMLAFVAHEIRTPLAGLLGTLALLAGSPLSPADRRLVETARACGEAMRTTLEDILDLSRAEAGRLVLADVAFDPREPARQAVDTLAPAAAAKGIALSLDLSPTLPRAIRGDPARLRQVLLNLADNAVKATARGGVRIALDIAAGRLVAEVADSGPGIPPALRRRLFRRHEQGEGAGRGAGLGLAICRRLVRLMGGRIRLDTAPEGGARFRVELPLRTAAAPEPLASPPPAPPPAGARILLVEDSPALAAAIAAVLHKAGYQVEQARDAASALAAASARRPDLVLLDLGLPDAAGGALRAALADLPGLPVPVLALTGRPDSAAGQGFAAVLAKPAEPAVLLAAVAAALAAAQGPPLADPAVLAALSATVGADRLSALARVFAAETHQRLARLAASPSLAAIEAEAHGLAAAAGTFGCAALAALAARIEQAAAAGEEATARALLAELPPLVRRSLQAIGAGGEEP